jgi:hypothetical protein
VILFQHPNDAHHGQINRTVVYQIQKALDENITTEASETTIDLWLESPGGDGHAAFKLWLDLRHWCNKLRAVIPDFAKSAATLLVMGADEIFMDPTAELGPIDIQIEHPDREGVRVSALDVANALDYLIERAVEHTLKAGPSIIKWTSLPRVEVLRSVTHFVSEILTPIASKLDPNLIHRASNQLRIAEHYAFTMLLNRNLADEDKNRAPDIRALARKLSTRYPVHEFVISRSEAIEMGFPVRKGRQYFRWKEVIAIYREFIEESNDSLISVQSDAALFGSHVGGNINYGTGNNNDS